MIHDTSRISQLQSLARLIRFYSLRATTTAASGHPASALSATDLMTGLLFGGTFRFDVENPGHPNNDRLVFSKRHASPLFCALWSAAGKVSEAELSSYRQFGSRLEGHPTRRFPYAEAATGSLGLGLGIGFGLALNARYLDRLPYRTYVLLGDSEMAEGSQWETIQLAAHYRLSNLVGIIDVNGLGQRGETMLGHDTAAYARRLEAFGWRTRVIDGHAMPEILEVFDDAAAASEGDQPFMIIARTLKGKGVSFLENAGGWHGRALKPEQLDEALRELGPVDRELRGTIVMPERLHPRVEAAGAASAVAYEVGQPVAENRDEFPIGGSKVLRQTNDDAVTILATGATVDEALDAHERLRSEGIAARVIDVGSLKPIDEQTLRKAAEETAGFATVEDHYPAGGLGEAVRSSLAENPPPTAVLAVKKKKSRRRKALARH